MYGKLDNNGDISFYNGYSVHYGSLTTTNPNSIALTAAGYKEVISVEAPIQITDAKIKVIFSEQINRILMIHRSENALAVGQQENYNE